MALKVQIPPLGESVTEAVIAKWLKEDGAAVKTDEPVCELETDKANVELPSPGNGVLRHTAKAGDTVKIGDVVAEIAEGAAASAPAKAAPAAKPAAPVAAAPKAAAPAPKSGASAAESSEALSPSVRKALREHPVDVDKLEGTGPRGRIVKEDILRAAEGNGGADGAKAAPAAAAPIAPKMPAPAGAGVLLAGQRRVPMTKIRKRIAERLVSAQHTAAMLTTFNEIDMSAVLELRDKYRESFTKKHGVSLGLMSFFARACALALAEFPSVNAFIEGDDVIYNDNVNLGIAVSTERGLVVPVLRHVSDMDFAKVESEIKRMAASAKEGKLSLNELTGGTFTITNGGVFGSLMSTPILNPPQSGILGMHAIQKRPIAVDDKIVIRPMMYVALSYDHRLVDGRESVSFLVKVKQLIEDPHRLMLAI
jgi:2-oxoglutarate dehydrogenase E2 component (dihydrolipoamide succinyltransferase)